MSEYVSLDFFLFSKIGSLISDLNFFPEILIFDLNFGVWPKYGINMGLY